MKTTQRFLVLPFFLCCIAAANAQVQWFQNQDGNNPPPNGTSPVCARNFGVNNFAACYLWRIENDTYTWKISKTNFSGTELRSFFVSGITSQVDIRVGADNNLFVLQRNYPIGLDPQYILYRLDANLHVRSQKTLSFPNQYAVFNLVCFEVDDNNNVYLAGDGQYATGTGNYEPASFVMKTNRDLNMQWRKMNNSLTSYTRMHVDNSGKIIVIEDHYTFFPEIRVKKFSAGGQLLQSKTYSTDPGRFTLSSALDGDDNLLLYGGMTIGDTAQGIYLWKISRNTGSVVYQRRHFVAPGSQLNDLQVDGQGRVFALTTLYFPTEQQSRISRINAGTGNIVWNHSVSYVQDSCLLAKLVIGSSERFYAIGQRNSGNYFAKGFAVQMRKSGACDGNIAGPDSVNYERIHWLSDGVVDNNERLISIGGTFRLDTINFETSDVRAFAVRFGNNNCANKGEANSSFVSVGDNKEENVIEDADTKLSVYPNPVSDRLIVSNLQSGGYDRVSVYNMQGALLLKQESNGNTAQLDTRSFADGVYLLVLRSSSTMKEKSLKFVVKK